MATTPKKIILKGTQLIETIRDTIYEVLEEELDRQIAENEKTRRLVERYRAKKQALQEKKEALKKNLSPKTKKSATK